MIGPPRLQQLFLKPGELFVCREPSVVTTLLGSCVSVTMFHPRLKLGAICHALLPKPGGAEHNPQAPNDPFKYVSLVIPAMREIFLLHHVLPEDIEVKLFGGAAVLIPGQGDGSDRSIGTANVRHARMLLDAANLRIKRAHVGGVLGRKLLFNTLTGDVLLKQLSHHGNAKNQSPHRR